MIRPVSYAEILNNPNAEELLAEYAAECSLPELGTAAPQRELYELLEKSADFRAFGVYDGEMLVGFAAVLIYVLPHYGTKIAATESVFIMDSQRNTAAWKDLETHMEQHARTNGCVAFICTAPVGSRFDRMMSASKRRRHTNNVYLKVLA